MGDLLLLVIILLTEIGHTDGDGIEVLIFCQHIGIEHRLGKMPFPVILDEII